MSLVYDQRNTSKKGKLEDTYNCVFEIMGLRRENILIFLYNDAELSNTDFVALREFCEGPAVLCDDA